MNGPRVLSWWLLWDVRNEFIDKNLRNTNNPSHFKMAYSGEFYSAHKQFH